MSSFVAPLPAECHRLPEVSWWPPLSAEVMTFPSFECCPAACELASFTCCPALTVVFRLGARGGTRGDRCATSLLVPSRVTCGPRCPSHRQSVTLLSRLREENYETSFLVSERNMYPPFKTRCHCNKKRSIEHNSLMYQ